MNSYSMTSTLLKMKLTKVTSMVPSTVHQTSPHSIRVPRTPRPIRARFTLVTQAMSFSLPDLPYAYDALEPFVDTQTMTIHHTKHHQTYVTNVNNVVAKYSDLQGLDLVELNKRIGKGEVPSDVSTALRNNGGGHWNHTFFWKIMTNPSNTSGPGGELKQAIEASFGSVDALKEKFNAAATTRFGSGWAWLVVTPEGKLVVTSTPNQDNPLQAGLVDQAGTPVLGLDVWEHAYYLKYQNRRPEYINAWWSVVNWEQAEENFKAAK
ncbi:MSD1 [Auxenochlorella protothecoides x Auxenochlorella symbiontica]